jgi:YVTN family beta-propeller protein
MAHDSLRWLGLLAVAAVMALPGSVGLRGPSPSPRAAPEQDVTSLEAMDGSPAASSSSTPATIGVLATLLSYNNSLLPRNVTAPGCSSPLSAAYDSGRGEIFVLCGGTDEAIGLDQVVILSAATDSVVGTVSSGVGAADVVYDSGRGEVYVSGAGRFVSAINDTSDTSVARIEVGVFPLGLAYDPAQGEIFVANDGSNTVSVINDTNNTVIATIPLGFSPEAVAYAAHSNEVFASGYTPSQLGEVSEINASSNAVNTTVQVGRDPDAEVYDGGVNDVFVGNFVSANVSVVSASTNSVVATVPIGADPEFLSYDAGRGEILVVGQSPSGFGSNLSVIADANDSVVATVPLEPLSSGVTYDASANEYFVVDAGDETVQAYSDVTNTPVATAIVGGFLLGAAYDAGRGEVFISDDGGEAGNGSVLVLSQTTDQVLDRIAVGAGPQGLAYDSGTGEVFVADAASHGTVSVISDSNNSVVATVAVGSEPVAVAYDPVDGKVFVADENSSNVSVISDTNDSVVGTIALGSPAPQALAYDNRTDQVFVAAGGNLSVIDAATDSIAATVPVGGNASAVACDPRNGEIFVANSGSGSVDIVSDVNDALVATMPDPNFQASDTYEGIAIDTSTDEVLVTTRSTPLVSVFSETAVRFEGTVTVAGASPSPGYPTPWGIAFDPQNGRTYVADSYSGEVSVLAPFYPLTFSSQGLPPGSSWQVSAGTFLHGVASNVTVGAHGRILFDAAVGPLDFSIAPPAGYGVSRVTGPSDPSQGAVTVNGSTTVAVSFRKLETLTFNETGLPPGTGWGVEITSSYSHGGPPAQNLTGTGSSISFSVVEGSWKYQISPISTNYRSIPVRGSVTVGARAASRAVRFQLVAEELILQEQGLAPGDNWTVSLTGTRNLTITEPAGTPITLELTNGSYYLTVEPSSGKVPSLRSQSLEIVAPHRALGFTIEFT